MSGGRVWSCGQRAQQPRSPSRSSGGHALAQHSEEVPRSLGRHGGLRLGVSLGVSRYWTVAVQASLSLCPRGGPALPSESLRVGLRHPTHERAPEAGERECPPHPRHCLCRHARVPKSVSRSQRPHAASRRPANAHPQRGWPEQRARGIPPRRGRPTSGTDTS